MEVVRGAARTARQLVLLLLVCIVAAAIVPAVLGMSSMDGARTDAAEWGAVSGQQLDRIRSAWPALDAAARQAAAPVRTPDNDRAALRELIAGTLEPGSVRAAPAVVATLDADTTAWARYGALGLLPPSRQSSLRGMYAGPPRRFDDEVREQLAADTVTPWLGVWRGAATSIEPPATWQYRTGAPGLDGTLGLPAIGVQRFSRLAWTNEAVAILMLDRRLPGDDSLAVRRARENVAMWHLLARSPHMTEHAAGFEGLSEAAMFLAWVGEVTGDGVAAADGERLGRAVHAMRPFGFAGAGPRSPDPDEAVQLALALAADRALPPAVRTTAVQELVVASCLATSDMLLGTSWTTRGSMREIGARLADVDPEGRLRPAIERADAGWDAFTRGGGWRRTRVDPPGWTTTLEAAGMGGLAGRVMACAER